MFRQVFEKIVIPRSVRFIRPWAFDYCENLSSLCFEDGSQIAAVGRGAFFDTKLRRGVQSRLRWRRTGVSTGGDSSFKPYFEYYPAVMLHFVLGRPSKDLIL